MGRLLAIVLAALATLVGAALAASAIRAGRQPHFSVLVSPTHQSAVRGGTAQFGVDVGRSENAGAITLDTSDLPRGISSSWQLAGGTRSGVVPRSETGAVLILRTSADTPLGTRRVKVLATGAGSTRTRALALTVMRPGHRRFSLRVGPSRQIVPQGAGASYRIRIARAAHFHRRVSLRMLRLPRGVRAKLTTNAVKFATKASVRPGSYRLVVEGRSWVGGRAVRRNAVVVLSVVMARPLRIRGDLSTLLHPGADAPLDLVLTNPYRFDLRVVTLKVRVGSRTSSPRCDGDANFAVAQFRGRYALWLRPGSTRLSALVPDSSGWPRVFMRDLPTDQDACKGVVVSLDYRGTATR